MKTKLMSDERQEQLMKAAEATVQLMNVGVDGDAALAKVAADSLMNEHEIDLVTHAVNNSRQLAHLQSSSAEDKEKPFPLIDGARVKAIKPQPWTNAEQNSGRRYNLQEEPTPNGEAKADAPDAIGIQQNIMKDTPKPKGPADYHVREPVDHLAVLNKEWGISSKDAKTAAELPEYKTEHVWADVQREQHKRAELRITFTQARDQVGHTLDVLAEGFRRLDAPKFAQVELAAQHAQVDQQLIDILYEHAGLEQFGEKRAESVKHASTKMYVPQNVLQVVQQLEQIGELMKTAQTAWAELVKIADEEDGDRKSKGGQGGGGGAKGGLMQLDPGGSSPDLISGTLQDTIGLGENPTDTVQQMMGHAKDVEPSKAHLGEREQTDINQADTQLRLKRLMGDQFISGHSLPEVVDAYNAALSVNPGFGDTELTSYMRQHLATKGGVPFDLQLRAAQGRDRNDQ